MEGLSLVQRTELFVVGEVQVGEVHAGGAAFLLGVRAGHLGGEVDVVAHGDGVRKFLAHGHGGEGSNKEGSFDHHFVEERVLGSREW